MSREASSGEPRPRRSLAEFEAFIATALEPPFDSGPPVLASARARPGAPPVPEVLDRVTRGMHGGPPAESPAGEPDEVRDARSLDDIEADLAPRRPTVEAPPAEPAGARSTGPSDPGRGPRRTGDGWGVPTYYLEERLRIAYGTASSIGSEVEELDRRWKAIRTSMESLREEIDRAHREMEFVRELGWEDPEPDGTAPHSPGPAVAASPAPAAEAGRVARAAPSPAPPPGEAPFRSFTVGRYNDTVNDLKSRRRHLLLWTVVLAGLLSAVLVTMTASVQEPTPPVWIAALPAIWMIPVPFFLLAFRGTQRVLKRNHLTLDREP